MTARVALLSTSVLERLRAIPEVFTHVVLCDPSGEAAAARRYLDPDLPVALFVGSLPEDENAAREMAREVFAVDDSAVGLVGPSDPIQTNSLDNE